MTENDTLPGLDRDAFAVLRTPSDALAAQAVDRIITRRSPACATPAANVALPAPFSLTVPDTFEADAVIGVLLQLGVLSADLRPERPVIGIPLSSATLDVTAAIRARIIRDLLRLELRSGSVDALAARLRRCGGADITPDVLGTLRVHGEGHEAAYPRPEIVPPLPEIEEPAPAETPAPPASIEPSASPPPAADIVPEPLPEADKPVAPSPAASPVEMALRADPTKSDRAIARECGVSPTIVGRVRGALGLKSTARTVVRGGKTYEVRPT